MEKIFKDKGVITAIVALIVVVVAYFGVDLPKAEFTDAVLSGDSAHVLSVILGAVIGLLGGYRAKTAKDKPK